MSATRIESEGKIINSSIKSIFDYLCDFNNIRDLLPPDRISEWTSSVDSCSFKIQNAALIPLEKDTVKPHTQINIVSGKKAPFPFTLVLHLSPLDSGLETEIYMIFEGEINAFLKMMVLGPLTNLFNHMTKELQTKFA